MPHLLLVDDDPEALEWLSELAKGEGFTVSQADSLRAARIHMSRLQPDVLLTDLQLPDGQGIELVNDLESKETTEVVLITGHASGVDTPASGRARAEKAATALAVSELRR